MCACTLKSRRVKKGEHTPTFDRETQHFARTMLNLNLIQRMVKNVHFPGKGRQSLIYEFVKC